MVVGWRRGVRPCTGQPYPFRHDGAFARGELV